MSIGVFVDVENMVGGLGKRFTTIPLDALVVESVQLHKLKMDDVRFIGLYAPWKGSGHAGLAAMEEKIALADVAILETPFSPAHGGVPAKSAADNQLVIDAAEGSLTGAYDRFVVISGDFDMLPLALWLREKHGRFVAGVGRADATKIATAKAYDRFAFYSERDIVRVAQDPAGLTGNPARLRRALLDLFAEQGSTLPTSFVAARLKSIVQEEWREYAYERFLRSSVGEVGLKRVIETLFPDGLVAWKGDFLERKDPSHVFRGSGVGPASAPELWGPLDEADEPGEWDEDRMAVFTLQST